MTGRSEVARHAAPLALDLLVEAGVLAAPADGTREAWVDVLRLRIEAALGDRIGQLQLDRLAASGNGRPPDDPEILNPKED